MVGPTLFFTALTANRTIVEALGTFDAGTMTILANQVELE